MQTYKEQTFTSATITVDEEDFIRCIFNGCTLVYSGGLINFDNCIFSEHIRWEFKDAALRTLTLLSKIGMLREDAHQKFINPTEKPS